jgi:hypothetical protein
LNQERTEARIASLTKALADAAAQQREQHRGHKYLVVECLQGQENIGRVHSSIVAGLKQEAQVREQHFKNHVQLVERHAGKEQQKLAAAASAAKTSYEDLRAFRRQTQRQCTRQLGAADRDITAIENLLSKENEDKFNVSSPAAKIESLTRANDVLRQKVQNLESLLDHQREQRQTAAAAVKQSRTPKKVRRPPAEDSFQSRLRRSVD